MSAPTLINLPPPSSNPDTPSEMPGTPNSTTTSLSALSTTAIKDGHRGTTLPHSSHHHHTPSANTLEAERADRISRLAGLERVTTARAPGGNPSAPSVGGPSHGQIAGYFDAAGNPIYATKKSTVGSASATGSVGGRTGTWASGSRLDEDEDTEGDKMSIDTNLRDLDERDQFSTVDQSEYGEIDGMSDEASLVAFGEGAGSTVSGPIYTRSSQHAATSPTLQKAMFQPPYAGDSTSSMTTTASAIEQRKDARMLDGLADGHPDGFVDTTLRSPIPIRPAGAEGSDRAMFDGLNDGERAPPLGDPQDGALGKFFFEEKK